MTSIGRGQPNTPCRLRFFTTTGTGAAQDSFSVQYRVYDDTSGTPVQVFPPVGSEIVTTGPGRFDTGAYYAYDSSTGLGWAPPQSANLGNWHVEWDVVTVSGDASSTITEEFEVVETASRATPDPLYIGVADVRATGVPTELTAQTLESDIRLWQEYIIRATRQWYHPVHLELCVDGTDSDTLHFGVPIITVDEVRLNHSTSALDPSEYEAYTTAQRYPDNNANPRIKLSTSTPGGHDIYTAPRSGARFLKGRRNQFVSGTFGRVEVDGSVPLLIKRALLKVVVAKATTPVYAVTGVAPPPALTGVIVEEWTDGHKVKYDTSATSQTPRSPGSGIVSDPEVRGIIRMFKAPIGIATPNDPSPF